MKHAHRMKNLTGIRGEAVKPGSAEWLATMSASKVAAVLGLSPYKSAFSLWHEMAGNVPRDEQTTAMARGHYLEAGIASWMQDQHPEWTLVDGGTWAHRLNPMFTASPDRIALVPRKAAHLVEIKTASDGNEWGRQLDEIPAGYRAQVVWQMYVTGANKCHIGVLLPFLELREYVIHHDPAESEYIAGRVEAFLASLEAGIPPRLDGADSTYLTVKQLHPDITPAEVEIDRTMVERWLICRDGAAQASANEQQARAEIVLAMGEARKATCYGITLGTRSAKQGGTPYFTASKSLPTADKFCTREDAA